MNNKLNNKIGTYLSTYISNIIPETSGALTIVDNTNNQIDGLVPNSLNLFLDDIFLASGYGFSSYEMYHNVSYIANSYNDVYAYILDKLSYIEPNELKFTYTENKFDKKYNKYGWLISYSYLTVEKNNEGYNQISLNTNDLTYIDNIYFDINSNIYEIGENINLSCYFHSNNSIEDNKVINWEQLEESSPEVYINNERVFYPENINQLEIESDKIIKYNYVFEQPNNDDLNITIQTKRNNEIIYSYQFPLKFRPKILALNSNQNSVNYEILKNFDDMSFFDIDLMDNNLGQPLLTLTNEEYQDNYVFIDESIDIEFFGQIYYNTNSTQYIYPHDYFICKNSFVEFDFYLNNIKTNWNYIIFDYQGIKYRLYKSPQRYIGKHIWTIKIHHE